MSWDGKLTLCPWDRRLENTIGAVTHGRLSELWRGEERLAIARSCQGRGVPERDLCRDCPSPWSPNHGS